MTGKTFATCFTRPYFASRCLRDVFHIRAPRLFGKDVEVLSYPISENEEGYVAYFDSIQMGDESRCVFIHLDNNENVLKHVRSIEHHLGYRAGDRKYVIVTFTNHQIVPECSTPYLNARIYDRVRHPIADDRDYVYLLTHNGNVVKEYFLQALCCYLQGVPCECDDMQIIEDVVAGIEAKQ